MKQTFVTLMAAALAVALHGQACAAVKLPAYFGNGMVIQREQPATIRGTADAGETVSVSFVKNEAAKCLKMPQALKGHKLQKAYTATADAQGQWSIELPPLKHGGPFALKINDIELVDILIGDVLLCTGQSNMELPVARVTDMFADEIADYENTQIRHYIVPKVFNFSAPQDDTPKAQWTRLDAGHVMQFSALAYFTAKKLYAETQVPVGIVNSSWGGTPVEAWMSEEALAPLCPRCINQKRQFENDAYRDLIKRTEGQAFYTWNNILYSSDPGMAGPVKWFADNYDDSNWHTTDMLADTWSADGSRLGAGSHWLRKTVSVPQEWDGQEAMLRLGCIVDADSVYVNGVFVGTTGYQYPPRKYNIPAGVLRAGNNTVTVRIISNGAKPHFVPEKPYKIICNGSEVSLEGEWKYRTGAEMPSAPSMKFFCYEPVCLYNAMIAPLRGMKFRAAVWYQGESNVGSPHYATRLKALMADWRKTFGAAELPFYIVELADFLHKSDTGGRAAWADLRKQQAQAADETPNAWLVKNSDLGEWNDIHPLDKKTLGNRVADKMLETILKTK